METETEEQRQAREVELKQICEPLGLIVKGSIVIAPIGCKPVAVDASSIDLASLVANLIYQAHKQGVELGRNQIAAEITNLFGESI